MNLIDQYQHCVKAQNLQQDDLQLSAINKLQLIAQQLQINNVKARFFKKKSNIKGLYLWGGVGRGKTFIMDLFFNALTIEQKRRQHFNHFMQEIHQRLQMHKGQKNSLQQVANDIAAQTRIICFDEFFVEDIADAMILGRLFQLLFAKGVTLVATSNIPPEKLYQGGLQRHLFLPAIDSLKAHVEVFNLDQGIDYRQNQLRSTQNYFFPLPQANIQLADRFKHTASDMVLYDTEIILEERLVNVLGVDEKAIWFDFHAICGHARGVSDYMALAKKFDEIFISNIPILNTKNEDQARRFIAMIDEFYDEDKIVIIAAETHFNELYQGERLAFEYQRTASRLHQMQDINYFKRDQRLF
ncbi:cell division protein ZapE [Facilibium subflavum]|uniref:cell division protein ZapE n=1 Tax=Facilibium subflavum TaxID=2219058 RepID=UPI000E64F818|nr:cell division protein ZapE [Facilibium subflavum]